MKKTTLFILTSMFSLFGFAQQELLEHDWKLHYMVIDGVTINVPPPQPFDFDYDPGIQFYDDFIEYEVTAIIDFNVFSDGLPPVIIDEDSFIVNEPSVTLGDCNYCLLESQYLGVILFGDGASQRTFGYEIIDGTDDKKTLIITTPEGNTAVHGNYYLLSTDDFEKESITIYPNPAKNKLTINSKEWALEKIEVYSILGSHVLERTGLDPNSSIDVSFLKPGIYFAQITIENGNKHMYQFIKE